VDKSKIKKKMLSEKEEELIRYQILEEYLKERIEEKEEVDRRQDLVKVQRLIAELKNLVSFLKK